MVIEVKETKKSVATRVLAGGILVFAAVAKITYGGGIGNAAMIQSPFLASVVVQFELCLGIWLLSGFKRGLSVCFGALTFSIFAIASSYLVSIGESDCGCFGAIKIHPLYTLVFDLVVLAALLSEVFAARTTTAVSFRIWSALTGMALIAFMFAGSVWSSEIQYVRDYLVGQPVILSPATLEFGQVDEAGVASKELTVFNNSSRPIKYLGCSTKCNARISMKAGETIPAGDSIEALIKMHFSGSEGVVRRNITFYFDHPTKTSVELTVSARIR